MRGSCSVLPAALAAAMLCGAARVLPAAEAPDPSAPSSGASGKTLKDLDPFYGEYEGTYTPAGGKAAPAVAKIACFGTGTYQGLAYAPPPTGDEGGLGQKVLEIKLTGKAADGVLALAGKGPGGQWTGKAAEGRLSLSAAGDGGGALDLKHVVRKSPTELLPPPPGAVVLLPHEPGTSAGRANLDAWKNTKWKLLDDGTVVAGGGNNDTKRNFKDFKLHLEFCLPYQADKKGQARANSGVYVLGRYEVQILDSFGLEPQFNGCGSVYRVKAPKVNMTYPPLSWQTYDITFRAARFADDGKTVKEYPRITIVHNGVTVHDNFELRDATGAAKSKGHAATGPIQLQDHGNPVRFRNIWLVENNDQRNSK